MRDKHWYTLVRMGMDGRQLLAQECTACLGMPRHALGMPGLAIPTPEMPDLPSMDGCNGL